MAPGAFDVTECCRLCLKNASSAAATRIDLHQEQSVAEVVDEVYGIYIKGSHRGSSYICLPCYRNVANLKTYLDRHKSKSTLVMINQTLMEAQDDAFLEESDDDDVYCDSRPGYRRPASSPVDMLLKLKDCMQSKRFREALTDRYELGHLLVSGPIIQKGADSLDQWHPIQLYCHKCRRKFDCRATFDEHTISCKFKCLFCSRNYTHEETLHLHSCPKRDKYKKAKKRKSKLNRLNNSFKTSNATPSPAKEQASSNNAATLVEEKDKEEITNVITIPETLPPPVKAPTIEGEANLDAELTNLLERWYGQGEEIEELSHLSVGTIDAPPENGVFTNSELYSRIIDSNYQNTASAPKPAISVRPMSQLIETPVEQNLPSNVPDLAPISNTDSQVPVPMEVIEIDDDDDAHTALPVNDSTNVPVIDKPEQALSEKDILNIVKHFRGIDENESYLVKAKINGAQKLICISKRKNEGGTQNPVVSPVGQNSNSALQSGSRNPPQKQIVITPSVKQPSNVHNTNTIVQPAAAKPCLIVKNVSAINGSPIPSVTDSSAGPQLKIAHVQSLVSDPGTSQKSTASNQPRLLNGANQSVTTVATKPNLSVRKVPTATFTVRTGPPKGAGNKPAPQRIIVGSNSLKFVSSAGGAATRFIPIAPKQAGPSPPRVIVQRKQVQTIIQSSTVTRTNLEGNVETTTTSSSTTTDINNAMLRSQLLQQPPKTYPSVGGVPQNGSRNVACKSTTLGGALAGLTGPNKQFKLNNTTIKRMN